jgi:hypothetical protein
LEALVVAYSDSLHLAERKKMQLPRLLLLQQQQSSESMAVDATTPQQQHSTDATVVDVSPPKTQDWHWMDVDLVPPMVNLEDVMRMDDTSQKRWWDYFLLHGLVYLLRFEIVA